MVTTIDPILDKRWDDFVIKHPESTIFHHSSWARVLADRYGCCPNYYVLENKYGEITAAAPFLQIGSRLTGKRIVCLPCSECCYPLAYDEDSLGQLLVRLREHVNEARLSYLEVRGWGKLGNPDEMGLKDYPYYLSHVVELDSDLQRVRAGMSRNGRYNLRYAEKSPVTVRVGQGENDLKDFYRLFNSTRRRLNLLPWPYHFFDSIYRHLIVPGHGYLLLAELGGRVIAANMYFCFKDRVTHEFNAADEDYFEYRPNYLLIWKAMEHACQESYRYYDFGRTQPENQNLAQFKRHWGSIETTWPYYYYPDVQGPSSIRKSSFVYQAYTTANRWAPEFVLRVIGRALYRHMT